MCFRGTQPPYLFLQLQFEKMGKYAEADPDELDGVGFRLEKI